MASRPRSAGKSTMFFFSRISDVLCQVWLPPHPVERVLEQNKAMPLALLLVK
jgi:hypothetical protein